MSNEMLKGPFFKKGLGLSPIQLPGIINLWVISRNYFTLILSILPSNLISDALFNGL